MMEYNFANKYLKNHQCPICGKSDIEILEDTYQENDKTPSVDVFCRCCKQTVWAKLMK